jgi:magnesium chelatase subunit I
VLPQIRTPSLAHDMLLLGLRGQAKTRLLRQLVHLARRRHSDRRRLGGQRRPARTRFRTIPRDMVAKGDDTPIEWVGRDRRYHEKLATPDVTIADLIGEIDMIKHAEGGTSPAKRRCTSA